MKFRIRYADRIVGFFVIVAMVSLVLVIFLLGSRQRWFARDFQYKTYADSAAGLSENMPVLFKGIQIGSVKNFRLSEDDRVEVHFSIYEEYNNRAREGSLIQILASPIGLGNQFVFHPGLGRELLEENSLVPAENSPEGRELVARGLGFIPSQNDTIALLVSKVNAILDEVNFALAGSQNSVLGRTLTDVELTIHALPAEMEQLRQITGDISVITGRLAGPDGVLSLLDGDGALVSGLESSITSLSGILSNIEKTTAYLPREMPQIAGLLAEARTALMQAEDVLIALRNNPLLKNGVPEHVETDSSGINPRNISF
jgi:phospholipid/cholesterol/gamma-HCH transport system substrate-binding protein